MISLSTTSDVHGSGEVSQRSTTAGAGSTPYDGVKSRPVAVGGDPDPPSAAASAVAFEADEADCGDCVNTFVEVLDDGARGGADAAGDGAGADAGDTAFEAGDCGDGV